jgi:monovalent cation:H+ antiporter-2, CPA2 family
LHNIDLILTITGGLAAALVLGYVTHRLGLSPIVGYLVAGTLVGPHTPGFVDNTGLAQQLAEIGVILLMFGVGLQFHVEELLAVRRVALPGAIVQSAAATVLGAVVAHAFGWSWRGGIVFGAALSVASTVVLVRVLSDSNDLHTPAGHIAVGWLVVEDLLTVAVLVLLPAVAAGQSSPALPQLGWALAVAAGKMLALVAFTVVVARRVIPGLLDRVAATRSRELFTLTVLVVALGIAVGAALLLDVSMALGAFLAGTIVGRSDYSLRAAAEALPMRDAFAVLFFVSVGMLLDPAFVLRAPWLVAAAVAIVVVGKPLIALVVIRLLRYPFDVALAVAAALGQIGEFSFMLSALGHDLGVVTEDATNAIIVVAIISIVANPVLYRAAGLVHGWVSRRPTLWRILNPEPRAETLHEAPRLPDQPHRAVVVGYGPSGRTLARLLNDNGIVPTIVELNIDTVRQLRDAGASVVYGDAAQEATLRTAGVAEAGTLILSAADMAGTTNAIRIARELNPGIRVFARTPHLRDGAALRKAGAHEVFSGEGEVALAMTETLLRQLGATPEQIDRERARAHGELFELE